MGSKCADAIMHLDIDEMILDYLIFAAMSEILNSYDRQIHDVDDAKFKRTPGVLLQLVDCEHWHIAGPSST